MFLHLHLVLEESVALLTLTGPVVREELDCVCEWEPSGGPMDDTKWERCIRADGLGLDGAALT